MSISEIRNPVLRRAVLLAIMPVWLPFMVLLAAGLGIVEQTDRAVEALRDAWRGTQ